MNYKMQKQWRLILDDKKNGFLNMAIDEAIFDNYLKYKIPTFRVYGWEEPFLTLGYGQNPDKVLIKDQSVPFVKRITGGAAILHDKEITYSIICSSEDLNLPVKVKDSYKSLCSFIIKFYSRLDLEAKFAQDIDSSYLSRYENFCFSSFEPFDLTVNGKKIGGNAQKRKRNIIFQHGSIPQKIDFQLISRSVKGVKGIENKIGWLDGLLEVNTDYWVLRKILAESFRKVFCVGFSEENLFKEEILKVGKILKDRNFDNNKLNIKDEKTSLA